ncbi:hypothetical protein ACWDZ5_33640, partial [Streptomyces sp. NPDC002996]
IHADDIADAVDYPYAPPSGRHLNRMIDLAARFSRFRLHAAARAVSGRTRAETLRFWGTALHASTS